MSTESLFKDSKKDFLDSLRTYSVKRGAQRAIELYEEFYKKPISEILDQRLIDCTPLAGENPVLFARRKARQEQGLDDFHHFMTSKKNLSTNSASVYVQKILKLYRRNKLMSRDDIESTALCKTREESKEKFPLGIEETIKMFNLADRMEQVAISLATDLGLRITDFLEIKKTEIETALRNEKAPYPLSILTKKEGVYSHGFISEETAVLLREYLPTLPKENPYLFPSERKGCEKIHLSGRGLNHKLKVLAKRANINLNGNTLSFHCFRGQIMTASLKSKVGVDVGKMLVGKKLEEKAYLKLTEDDKKELFNTVKREIQIQPSILIEKKTLVEENQILKDKLDDMVNKYEEILDYLKQLNSKNSLFDSQ